MPAVALGEIGVAFVVPAESAPPTLEALRVACAAELADYKAPDRLVIVDELPIATMGKVDKLALRALASPA